MRRLLQNSSPKPRQSPQSILSRALPEKIRAGATSEYEENSESSAPASPPPRSEISFIACDFLTVETVWLKTMLVQGYRAKGTIRERRRLRSRVTSGMS